MTGSPRGGRLLTSRTRKSSSEPRRDREAKPHEVEVDETMSLRVTLIQGGGIGFDQIPAVQRILEAAGVRIDWDEHLAGQASLERGGPALPEAMLQSVR